MNLDVDQHEEAELRKTSELQAIDIIKINTLRVYPRYTANYNCKVTKV
jgi:hypothetical protein